MSHFKPPLYTPTHHTQKPPIHVRSYRTVEHLHVITKYISKHSSQKHGGAKN